MVLESVLCSFFPRCCPPGASRWGTVSPPLCHLSHVAGGTVSSVSFVPRCWGDCLLCVICPTLLGGLCLLLCVALSWADSRVSCLVSGPCCMQSSSSRVESCLLSVSLLTALSDFDMGAVLIPGLLRLGPQAQGRQDGPCLSRGTPGASAAEESRCSVHGR